MHIVGAGISRIDSLEKVTGQAKYIDDYRFPDMLYAKVFRSPVPHCRILRLSTDRASAHPRVAAVLTARDIPGANIIPLILQDHPLLANETARFAGDAIALVAAESETAAEEAAQLIQMEYELLPAVFDPRMALERDAPRIFGEDNIFQQYRIRKGDVAGGFAQAEAVVEGEFETGYQEHAYLETQGAVAYPASDGGITVIGSMQCPFYVRDAVATVLGLPLNRVTIRQTTTGGAFGGKEDVPSIVAAQAALLAWKTGRPVKLIYSREEDIVCTSKRHPSWSRVKLGAKKDGTLVAAEVKYILDAGAYATLSPVVLWRGTVHAAGPYRIPNVKVDSFAVATNKVPCGAFRGFGSPQIIFAIESVMDMLAEKLGMNPCELRRRNALTIGDSTATGHILTESVGLTETMEKAIVAADWDKAWIHPDRKKGARRSGMGMSSIFYGVGLGAEGKHMARAGAEVHVLRDGSVTISIGNTEIGQGARTAMAQIAAEALGAPSTKICVNEADTSRVPDSGPTVASRTTVMSGNAVLDACRRIAENLFRTAAEILNVPEREVILRNGTFFAKAGDRGVSYEEVVAECHDRKLPMSFQGWFVSPPTSFDGDGIGDAYFIYSFATNVAEVEVDMETGEVEVKRIVGAHDLGKTINPVMAEGQIEGGILQGMGYALMENIVSEEGAIKTDNFTTYIIPTSMDTPEIVPVLVEHPYSNGPYGAKGLGEPPLMGVAPAIANAIHNATGVRVRRIPVRPEDLMSAFSHKGGGDEYRE